MQVEFEFLRADVWPTHVLPFACLLFSVPYGVLLSGGLDSSLIASIAARVCATRVEDDGKSPAWWPRLHSFSVGLKDSPDLKAARIVADAIHTVHHEFHFTVEEGINALQDVIYHLETSVKTTSCAAFRGASVASGIMA